MNPGICSYAFRWAISSYHREGKMNIFSFIEAASTLGAKAIQLCDNLSVESLDNESLFKIKHCMNEKRLKLELGMKGSQPERVTKMIDICNLLHVDTLRIVLNDKNWKPNKREHIKNLEKLSKIALEKDVKLAIENHFEMSPFELADSIQKINSPALGICLDVVNSVTFLSGYKETCEVLAPNTISVHVKDVVLHRFPDLLSQCNDGISESMEKEICNRYNTGFYISGAPLGKGIVDIPWVLKSISKYNNNLNVFIENWLDPQDNIEDTVQLEYDMVKNDINKLKSYMYE